MPPARPEGHRGVGWEFLIPHSSFLIRGVWVVGRVPLDTILVFTADGCPHCAALCVDFDRRGVAYREINLSREPQEMDRLRGLSWEHRLPAILDFAGI